MHRLSGPVSSSIAARHHILSGRIPDSILTNKVSNEPIDNGAGSIHHDDVALIIGNLTSVKQIAPDLVDGFKHLTQVFLLG